MQRFDLLPLHMSDYIMPARSSHVMLTFHQVKNANWKLTHSV